MRAAQRPATRQPYLARLPRWLEEALVLIIRIAIRVSD